MELGRVDFENATLRFVKPATTRAALVRALDALVAAGRIAGYEILGDRVALHPPPNQTVNVTEIRAWCGGLFADH